MYIYNLLSKLLGGYCPKKCKCKPGQWGKYGDSLQTGVFGGKRLDGPGYCNNHCSPPRKEAPNGTCGSIDIDEKTFGAPGSTDCRGCKGMFII